MNKSAKFEYLFKESSHYLKTQFRDKWVLYVRWTRAGGEINRFPMGER